MTRLISVAASLLVGATIAIAPPAGAQTQAEIAERLNSEGKSAMYVNNYPEATLKFQQAASRVGEPGYYFNLCASLLHQARFDDAITACNAANNTDPPPQSELKAKIEKLTQRVKDEAKAQGVELRARGGGLPDPQSCATNPERPECNTAPPPSICAQNPSDPSCSPERRAYPPPVVGRPLTANFVTASKPDNNYTWTLGADLYGGGGAIGQEEFYGSVAAGLRIKGDFLLNRAARFGSQFYFQLTHFGAGEMDSAFVDTLDVFDVGAALYKHFCPSAAPYLCLTPLGGAHLALMSPAGESDDTGSQVFNYAAAGLRLELGAHIAFGRRQEHVLGVSAGANFYSSVFADPTEGFSRAEVGLDRGGGFGYLSFGYTYRFNTPLGSSPFVTLE